MKARGKTKIKIPESFKSAGKEDLMYITDAGEGIRRVRKGKKFEYYFKGKKITDTEELIRIKSLVIPPAWRNVWICRYSNGHLQATGIDLKNRKQYRYHPLWDAMRNEAKFYRMREFGKILPAIRKKIQKGLSLPGLPSEKVLAAVVSLMERTNIRVGNHMYEKLYGSFGITTLKDKHVKFKGEEVQFSFKGKKGVFHKITLRNKKLAAIVKKCRDIPGKELFQYYTSDRRHKVIDSGMVNEYIREISGKNFSAKDFRTWTGTVHALHAFRCLGDCDGKTMIKKRIVEALDIVSKQLGNSRNVCKKYYVHPAVINLYEKKCLGKYIKAIDKKELGEEKGLTIEEKILMRILKTEQHLKIAA
jgi:DNA topoisomerase I